MAKYFKGARPDGWDFHTHNTINYRENIGKTVSVPNLQGTPELCSNTVLHASTKPNGIFVGCEIPCSVFVVEGKPVIKDGDKCGFKTFKIREEIPHEKFDELFGWKYNEACNPINPFKIKPPKIGKEQIELLKAWDSVRTSVWDSVWDSIGDSGGNSVRTSAWDLVGDSVGESVRTSAWDLVGDSVRDSVWDLVWDSVRASVWNSVRASVWNSVWAYIGSMFPNIKQWKYIEHKQSQYPFQSTVDLWKQGLVPSFDGETWRLHGGSEAKTLFTISVKKLKET